MSTPQLTIIIPAFEEARRLPATLQGLEAASERWSFGWEALLVVEESRDATLSIAREAADRNPALKVIAPGVQRGKGHAVRTGMLEARGDIALFMDADLSVPLEEIPRFLDLFASAPGTDILIGSRKHAQSRILRSQSWIRRRMGEFFNTLLRLITRIPYRDTQCGFKAFRREAARAIFARQTIDGFAFDVEVLLLAERLGYTVREVPVEWTNSEDSRVRLVHDSVAMFRDAFVARRRVSQTVP